VDGTTCTGREQAECQAETRVDTVNAIQMAMRVTIRLPGADDPERQ
jgi:hypothetical protein